jgi:DnaJ-class molecular chaperone
VNAHSCCVIAQSPCAPPCERSTTVRSRMATTDEQQPAEPLACAPCRGTGQLISNLGGAPSQVTCPWCEGGGVQLPGHDAQAARAAA